MAHDVFISYSAEDKPTADAVCAALEAKRVRCWIAPRDVLPGVSYAGALIEAIKASRMMVLVFSSRSNNSPHVMREVERAVNKGIPIIPLRIEDVPLSPSMEYYISTPHWLDALTLPLEKHLGHLAETVNLLLLREDVETAQPRTSEAVVEKLPSEPRPLRDAFETAKQWVARPIVRLVAILAAAAGALSVIVLVLASPFDDPSNLVVQPTTLPESPVVQATTPPGSPVVDTATPPEDSTATTSAAPTPNQGEVVTNITVTGFGAPGLTPSGIAWDGTHLWVAGDAELFKVDPTGKVMAVYSAPEVTPEGLTWDGATFWMFTTNYSEIYQFVIDESAGIEPRVVSSFESPNQTIGGTYDGLAWDGTGLWYSDTYNVYKLDTAGNILTRFSFGHEIAGLAWDGQRLWLAYNPFPDNATLVKTDTEGNVLLTFSSPVLQIDALTWGDEHLWAVGSDDLFTPLIYKIDVETVGQERAP